MCGLLAVSLKRGVPDHWASRTIVYSFPPRTQARRPTTAATAVAIATAIAIAAPIRNRTPEAEEDADGREGGRGWNPSPIIVAATAKSAARSEAEHPRGNAEPKTAAEPGY